MLWDGVSASIRQFARLGGGVLTLSSEVVSTLERHRQVAARSTEACGVLIARYGLDGNCVLIEQVTEPLFTDRRHHVRCWRSPAHQFAVNRAYRQSGGTLVYAGEWHTHPEPVPQPSPVDWAGWARKLHDPKVVADPLFFVIQGVRHVRVWEGARGSNTILALEQIGSDVPSAVED